jgi:SAM-dependent methyltransferase
MAEFKERETINGSDASIFERGRIKNPGYHKEIDRLFNFLIPSGCRVLELGCSTGRLLAGVKPSYGLGIDIDAEHITAAKYIHKHRPELDFKVENAESFSYEGEPFDYIILSDLTCVLSDVQRVFTNLQPACGIRTRVIIQFYSHLWRPILSFATLIGRRKKVKECNWLSLSDIENLLYLSGFEVITKGGRILLPLRIPIISWIANRFLAKIPFLRLLCLTWYVVARPFPEKPIHNFSKPSVSIVIPTRDEKGNIEDIFTRTPPMGKWTELIFVDGNSTDGTIEVIKAGIAKYSGKWKRVLLLNQTGKGKGQAVHQGFAECQGDILMILDSDLTMPPEELPKYYQAIIEAKGELINGCRLVYAMEKEAMRFLNMLANHTFAKLFSWLLGQPLKDTLCGTKVIWRDAYEYICKNRAYFGNFDPYGDFDLLFGAAKLNLKIVDMPIHYCERKYGQIKINRFRDGLLLLRMSLIAFWKFKILG